MTILNPITHARLLADIEHISAYAGVRQDFIRSSMTDVCGEGEIEWVRNYSHYKENGIAGLVLEGIANPEIRCQSIAGALIRNYIDARVIPLNVVLAAERVPSPSVLLIPNLFGVIVGKGMPAWRVQMLFDILLQRSVQNKPSVLAIQDRTEMKKLYGDAFNEFLDSFKVVKS